MEVKRRCWKPTGGYDLPKGGFMKNSDWKNNIEYGKCQYALVSITFLKYKIRLGEEVAKILALHEISSQKYS